MLAVQEDLATRQQLLKRLLDAREQSDALFKIVRPAALYDRPIPERHRIVFYIGHLEAFDWNLLHSNVLGEESFHPEFDRLFAFGIDPVAGGLPTDQPEDWPSIESVHDYVSTIRRTLDEKLSHDMPEPSGEARGFSIGTLLNVAIEHRLMHLETLAYMLHQLPLDRKIPQQKHSLFETRPVMPRMISILAGVAKLGLGRATGAFGWDNEFESHEIEVPAFEIDQFMVTSRQYLEFVRAGGYETRTFWSDAGWKWRSERGISHPVFWKKSGDQWRYRTMFEEIPLPLDWPVYVSHAEASAYACWAGKSLPTEVEWHRAVYGSPDRNDGDEQLYPWGNTAPTAHFGNFDFNSWDPQPVNTFPAGDSEFGVSGMVGNGWEWTSTVFAPFPGFQPFPFYRGYSADFFDGRHFVMKGGSARTAACMLRPTFRNWFQPHYQYVYAGFRCVNR
jgi:gamma-glutamyl hercynylcysteine S-oxide synthase